MFNKLYDFSKFGMEKYSIKPTPNNFDHFDMTRLSLVDC